MKKIVIPIFVLALIGFAGCRDWGITGIRGNGKVVNETRDIDNFRELELGGAYTVTIKIGPKPSLEIIGEENLLKYVRTTNDGDRLIIDTKKNISPRKEIKLKITVPKLNYIDLSGACDVYADNINSEKFTVDLSGAGSLVLNGRAERFDADMSGAASLKAKNLISREVRISLSGASSADVYANEYLDASVSGVGSINYYGNPKKVNKDVSGVGSVSRK